MKPVYVLACITVLLAFGCKKSGTPSLVSFTGTWQLYRVSGDVTIDYPASAGNLLKFSGNEYQKYSNGVLVKSGQFTITYDTTATLSTCLVYKPGQFTNRIIFDGDAAAQKVFAELDGDSLTLVSGCFALDGGSFSYYTRKAQQN